MLGSPAEASRLVGPNPTGAARRVSLAVREAARVHGLATPAPVLLAVSGGADSLALAVAALDVLGRGGTPVHTLTVDHGLRPGSASEAEEVRELLAALGADSRVVRVDVDPRGGPEDGARRARLDALSAEAWALGRAHGRAVPAPVLLGHTMDDQAETVLLRLARGSGASSLRAIAPCTEREGVPLVRPLLGVRRADTREACRQWGLTPVDDATNAADGPWRAADGSALRRAAVRERVLPALADALGVDPVPALARTADLCARDDDALEALADGLGVTATPADGAGVHLDASALAGQPVAVASRLVRRELVAAGARPGDLSSTHVDAVLALAASPRAGVRLDLPGVRVRCVRAEAGHVLLADGRV